MRLTHGHLVDDAVGVKVDVQAFRAEIHGDYRIWADNAARLRK